MKSLSGYFMTFILLSVLYYTSCTKPKNIVVGPSGVWICNGYESNRYPKTDSVRVWTGIDSQWMTYYTIADSAIPISGRQISILRGVNNTYIVKNLIYNSYYLAGSYGGTLDTITVKWDTLSFSRTDTATNSDIYDLNIPGIHTGKGVYVELDHNPATDKIHLVYDWYYPGPNYGDIGSTIFLDGVRK